MPKFNVNLSPSVYRLLGEIAADRSQTMAEVVRDSITHAAWMDDELRAGNHLLIERNGELKELVVGYASTLSKHGRPSLSLPSDEEPEPEAVAIVDKDQVAELAKRVRQLSDAAREHLVAIQTIAAEQQAVTASPDLPDAEEGRQKQIAANIEAEANEAAEQLEAAVATAKELEYA